MDNFENFLSVFQVSDMEVSISIEHHKMANIADRNHHPSRIRAPTSMVISFHLIGGSLSWNIVTSDGFGAIGLSSIDLV